MIAPGPDDNGDGALVRTRGSFRSVMQVTVAQQLPLQPQHQHQQPPQQSQHQQPLPPLQPQLPGLIVAGGADEDAGGGTHRQLSARW